MPLHAPRRLALIAAMLLLAACAETGTYRSSTSDAPKPTAPNFQAQLNALGIPLALPPGRAILINIPAYELVAFEDGTPVLRSRVIVGTPEDRTPRIDTYTSQVTFRPSWRPPPAMVARGEVRDGIRPPGDNNPLGFAAIGLAPGLQVYMHDTNQKYLFDRGRRALSHGCIRVERWDELIAWLLDQDLQWVHAMAASPPTKAFRTPPVPVLIRYLPLFPAADGRVLLHPDVYGLGGGMAAYRWAG
jgi:murein L,D-transpeptidase YcbB/YkuD